MAKLFDLAKNALRRILGRRDLVRANPITVLDPIVEAKKVRSPPPPPVRNDDGRGLIGPPVQIPPSQRSVPTPQETRDIAEVNETYNDIQLLGRDQGHDEGGIDGVMAKMRRVTSSNVWGYYFEVEGGYSQNVGKYRGSKSGLLYVTFLAEAPPGGKRPDSAGPTYVYFDVPVSKFEQFHAASDSSAGRAVWDYLRVRGTSWQHQHRYRLAQVQGDYVPRKATRDGFKDRQLLDPSGAKIPNATWAALSRLKHSPLADIRKYAGRMQALLLKEQGMRRSTLPARSFLPNRAAPNRGKPNRGN
jgi:hypothetical protein